jgi:N-acyl-phosphatidylethanolamine-hydrolysing phospholipase D
MPSQEELDEVFPVQPLDWEVLQHPLDPTKIQCTWLGHSSLLVQMGGINVLTDPVFAERASPVSFAGPKRYRPTPCTLEELTNNINIDVVLLSHNHYDHLCYDTVKFLAKSDPNIQFVVPLGLQSWMERWVTGSHTIHELDWHESTCPIPGTMLDITAVPMKHWSNRVGDRDKTLWCGYVVQSKSSKFLFPGDTAWFDGLADIVGEQYGPFDMAAIPIGAYEPNDFMKTSHINVEEAVQMKTAIKAKMAVPIHWGTFPLTIEPVMEPREKLVELMNDTEESTSFAPWFIGETRISE